METTVKKPNQTSFLEQMVVDHRAQRSAFLIEHTGDFVLEEDAVMPIEVYVPYFLQRHEYEMVITYSLARGMEIHGTHDQKERKEKEKLLLELSGIRALGEAGQEFNGDAPNFGSFSREMLKGIDNLMRQVQKRVAIVIQNLDRIVPEPGMTGIQPPEQLAVEEIVESWGNSHLLRGTQNIIVALTKQKGKVSTAVRNAFVNLSVQLPEREQIKTFLGLLQSVNSKNGAFGEMEEGQTTETFANISKGLRFSDIESLFRKAKVQSSPVMLSMVRDEKKKVITELADGGLNLMEPLKEGFNGIAGVDHVIKDLLEIARLLRTHPDSGRIPKCILFLGPPGTGKSSLARAFAYEAGGINVVSLGEILGPYVGESERRVDNVLRLLEGMAPVICFVDEVDTAFVSRGESTGDSGVSKRILGKILAALGDERLRGKVVFILASNRGDLLDAALRRRCQRVYLIAAPDARNRFKVIESLAHRDTITFAPDVVLTKIVQQTEGATGAELEIILSKAQEIADRDSNQDDAPVSQEYLESAIAEYKPNRDPLLYEFFDLAAISACPFLSGIPWYLPDKGLAHDECPEHVRAILNENGKIDMRKLNKRIHELASQCSLSAQMRRIG